VSTQLRFLGIAAYEIVGPEHRILVDPYLWEAGSVRPGDLEPPDVILVSHAASDHYGSAAAIAKRTGTPVICGADVRRMLMDEGVPAEQIRATVWGLLVEVKPGLLVRPVECHHWSVGELRDGTFVTGTPLAFIVEPEPGVRIYHYGDTAIFDMSLIGRLYQPTVGIFGCTDPVELSAGEIGAGRILTGEMSPDEAALAAEMLGVEVAIAAHYLTPNADTDAFIRHVLNGSDRRRRQAFAPTVGDVLTISPRDGHLAVAVES
jgi:L-ascorbate metabolism protein UlaG (beta-lactamase superfamily)